MKKKYKKVIYIFSSIIFISIILGVVKYSLRYIDDNPELYRTKTKSYPYRPNKQNNKLYFWV